MIADLWLLSHDGDPAAFQIMARHYSFHKYKDGRRNNLSYPNRMLFCGPGFKMVLVTPTYDALFVWRKFIDKSGQRGVNCAVFHSESNLLASDLILSAERRAWDKWPGERFYTYVDATKIQHTRQPGRCFIKAGWRYQKDEQGHKVRTGKGLYILEKFEWWTLTAPAE